MGGKASRRKGHDFERDVAARLRELGIKARRGQQGGGAVEPDVITPGWWIECKVGKRPNIMGALDQAERDSQAAHAQKNEVFSDSCFDRAAERWFPAPIPVAIVRQDYKKATVTMTLDDWLRLISRFE